MTDEAIFLDTLKFIREFTAYQPYVNIDNTIWRSFPHQQKEYLKAKLLQSGLATINQHQQDEFQLGAPAHGYIVNGDKKLEKRFLKYLNRQSDIKLFMVENFIKPDPTSPIISNQTDSGAKFLRNLKSKGLIEYEDNDLSHVSGDWYEDPPQNTKKRWFDTLHQPMYVTKVKRHFLRNPDSLPYTNPHKKQTNRYHIGTWIVKILNNDWFKLIVSGLIVIIVGTIILVKYKVLK